MAAPSISIVEEAASTNSLMAQQVSALPHGAVIAARRQTAGRGQRGNTWESEPYANLTFSMLLRPRSIMAVNQFELSMLVSLGVCDALRRAAGIDVKVKWPNDIYVGDKKICGILIENSLEGRRIGRSIAGIGINVNQQRFLSDAPNPVSMVNLTGRQFDLDTLLRDVCRTILDRFDVYEDASDRAALLQEYCSLLWRYGGYHKWHDVADGRTYEAEIADIAFTGHLTLRDRSGQEKTYAFKEVSAILYHTRSYKFP